jgi:hypothetical protein
MTLNIQNNPSSIATLVGIQPAVFGGLGKSLDKTINSFIQQKTEQAINTAFGDAVSNLKQQHNLPKFLANDLQKCVSSHHHPLPSFDSGLQHPHFNPIKNQLTATLKAFTNELTNIIIKAVVEKLVGNLNSAATGFPLRQLGETNPLPQGDFQRTQAPVTAPANAQPAAQPAAQPTTQTAPSAPTPNAAINAAAPQEVPSAKSWLEALAAVLGSTLGEKAGKMVKLSNHMSAISSAGVALKEGAKGLEGDAAKKAEVDQAANASEFTKAQTEMQAVSQEMSLLQNVFSNTIKSIGEALSQMARKG